MNHTAATHWSIALSTTRSIRWILHSCSCLQYQVAARGRRSRKHDDWKLLLESGHAKLHRTNKTGAMASPPLTASTKDDHYLPTAALLCLNFYSFIGSFFTFPEALKPLRQPGTQQTGKGKGRKTTEDNRGIMTAGRGWTSSPLFVSKPAAEQSQSKQWQQAQP